MPAATIIVTVTTLFDQRRASVTWNVSIGSMTVQAADANGVQQLRQLFKVRLKGAGSH